MLAQFFYKIWYGPRRLVWLLLWPVSVIYATVVWARQSAYKFGLLAIYNHAPFVIVVGSVSVGGAGKSPMVIALVKWCQQYNFKVGIISRGYGGSDTDTPNSVTADSQPSLVGDEALMLVQATQCPMVVCKDRVAAIESLVQSHTLDVVISDDGLGHLALGRDLELVMVHENYGLGNGSFLPAGPLRQALGTFSSKRLKVLSCANNNEIENNKGFNLLRNPSHLVHIQTGQVRSLDLLKGSCIVAMTGIAHPEPFFEMLRQAGANIYPLVFNDHHIFCADDLPNNDQRLLIMTAKDAVKCTNFCGERAYYLELDLDMSETLESALAAALEPSRQQPAALQ